MDILKVLADAETAATFCKALLDKGVPESAAVSLTSSYILAMRFGGPSSEPWKDEDSH